MDGFVHVGAGRLVDGFGEPLTLRGVGLGNWLLPEGYMWKFGHPGPQSPREIEALIEDLVGPIEAREFWRRFRDTFITEADIARIRAEGMNHVRLPINSRVVIDDDGRLIESGFELIDRLIEWCRRHQLWVVLDLHGAPGGQTGTKIDDSPNGAPELFTEDSHRELTVKLWRAIALRYRAETVVAAYDLLNEPLPNDFQHKFADRLVRLYTEVTLAIREVDPNHMISYEGTHWATNWEIFKKVWDQNSILQFHKYWSPPDRPSIQQYIDKGRALGLPIYMGEGGENYLDWVYTAFQLYDDCGISWNFWPWKKIETMTSPCSVNAPAGWDRVVAFAAGKSAKPDPAAVRETLNDLIEALSLSQCTYRGEVIAALFRRAPLTIPAVGFGFRGPGNSYGTAGAVPLNDFRIDDLVTIRQSNGLPGALDWSHNSGADRSSHDLLVSLGKDDWVSYDFEVTSPEGLRVTVDPVPARKNGPHPLGIAIDGVELDVDGAVNATTNILDMGRHTVRLTGHAPETLVRSIEVGRASPQAKRQRKHRGSAVS